MNTSIILKNGFSYQSYWGGEFREARKLGQGLEVGDHCSIRKYHDLELIRVKGIDWIKSYQDDPNFPGSYHLDYRSVCGHYKIAEYYGDDRKSRVFYPFKCTTWRKNMTSTFGNYLNGRRETFTSFKKAAVAVAKHEG